MYILIGTFTILNGQLSNPNRFGTTLAEGFSYLSIYVYYSSYYVTILPIFHISATIINTTDFNCVFLSKKEFFIWHSFRLYR